MAGRLDTWREHKKIEDEMKANDFQQDVDNFNSRRNGILHFDLKLCMLH